MKRSMKLACVDTSTFTESIALVEGDLLHGERNVRRAYGHASGLHADLSELLREAQWSLQDLEGFVIGVGPGSFTGLRVGMAAVKGLAYALDVPLYGISSAEALLSALVEPQGALALIDARRGEVYALGSGDSSLVTPRCCSPDELIRALADAGETPRALLGEGAAKYRERWRSAWPEVLIPKSESMHIPRASLLATVFFERLERGEMSESSVAALEPIYVRPSDAEINYPEGFPSAARHFLS